MAVNKMRILRYLNPGALISKEIEQLHWGAALLVSGSAFGLLFLQTAMDQNTVFILDAMDIIVRTLTGLVFGTLGVMLIAGLIWTFSSSDKKEWTMGRTIRAVGLSYMSPLLALFFGLILNLVLSTTTAVAFGVAGLLWALNPMFRVIREMNKGNVPAAVGMTTFVGILTLFGWHYLV